VASSGEHPGEGWSDVAGGITDDRDSSRHAYETK
jgi:hypothetical protein